MAVYDQVKRALQDVVAPELSAIKGEIRRLDEKIDSTRNELLARTDALDKKIDGTKNELLARTDALDEKIDSTKNELLAEIKRVDSRMESLEREVRVSLEIRERLAAVEAKLGISHQ